MRVLFAVIYFRAYIVPMGKNQNGVMYKLFKWVVKPVISHELDQYSISRKPTKLAQWASCRKMYTYL